MTDTDARLAQTIARTIATEIGAQPTQAAAAIAACTEVPVALERLEQAGFLTEATRLVAHALPKREAVWWACMCVSHTAPPDLPSIDRAAREAAEEWVRQQTDKSRRLAFDHRTDAAVQRHRFVEAAEVVQVAVVRPVVDDADQEEHAR